MLYFEYTSRMYLEWVSEGLEDGESGRFSDEWRLTKSCLQESTSQTCAYLCWVDTNSNQCQSCCLEEEGREEMMEWEGREGKGREGKGGRSSQWLTPCPSWWWNWSFLHQWWLQQLCKVMWERVHGRGATESWKRDGTNTVYYSELKLLAIKHVPCAHWNCNY